MMLVRIRLLKLKNYSMAKTEKEEREYSVRHGSKKREIVIGRINAFRNYSKDIHFLYGG